MLDLDIIQFATSPLGLGFREELNGYDLTPAQIVILKLCYDLPLCTEEIHTFRMELNGAVIRVTEKEYVRELRRLGRVQGRPGHFNSIVLGRMSGKSLLGQIILLYELYQRILAAELGANTPQGGLLFSEPTRNSALYKMDEIQLRLENLPFLRQRITSKTRQRVRLGSKKGEICLDVIALSEHRVKASSFSAAVLDELAYCSEMGRLATLPLCFTSPDHKVFSLTSSAGTSEYKKLHNQADLRIQFPTWYVGDWIPSSYYQGHRENMSKEKFDNEFGSVL